MIYDVSPVTERVIFARCATCRERVSQTWWTSLQGIGHDVCGSLLCNNCGTPELELRIPARLVMAGELGRTLRDQRWWLFSDGLFLFAEESYARLRIESDFGLEWQVHAAP